MLKSRQFLVQVVSIAVRYIAAQVIKALNFVVSSFVTVSLLD
jgi:hypothetical protein